MTGMSSDINAPEDLRRRTLGAFLESVEKKAYVIALAACKDQQIAMDIVQDAMFKMVRSYASKPAEQWTPLFFKVLQNRITDHHRKRGVGRLVQWFGKKSSEDTTTVDAVDQLPSDNITPDRLADSLQLNDAVRIALSELSNQQQQVLMYRLWQGLSVSETAQILAVSEGTVKTHLSRATKQLREQLREYHSE